MKPQENFPAAVPTLAQGRLCILLASLLWSTSGAFAKVLTRDTVLELNTPAIAPLQIAFLRALFAGLVLVPLLRRRDISFRPMMLVMAGCFAIMNATFVSALALGTAADAIVLQYTAPMWMYLACVFWLGEPADNRSLAAFGIALIGILIIVGGGWTADQLPVVGLGLLSGLAYAGVMVCLRLLHTSSSRWMTVINHMASALVLVPFVWYLDVPSVAQFVVLFLYGSVQMAVPYWLVARGVRAVSPQEAGTITLLEPLLNPLWAYLISGEEPRFWTVLGAAFILGALAWRYWPTRKPSTV